MYTSIWSQIRYVMNYLLSIMMEMEFKFWSLYLPPRSVSSRVKFIVLSFSWLGCATPAGVLTKKSHVKAYRDYRTNGLVFTKTSDYPSFVVRKRYRVKLSLGPFHRKWNFLLKTEFRSGYIQCIFLSYAIIKLSITVKILVWYHWFSYVCIN